MAQVARSFYVTLLMVGMVALLSTVYSMYLGRMMVTTHTPLISATHQIKYELAISHLELEERLAGDMSVSVESIRQHLDQAEWYAMVMLEGGQNEEGEFRALEDKTLRQTIYRLLQNTSNFEGQMLQRLSMTGEKAGTDADSHFDAVFEVLLAD
ncbi:MAG: hypothetical protein Q9M19_01115, partial [Mariprofundaceae bacterium]|nr:hypothetical protein [Mariprofundaceae bacterium]